MGYIDKEEIGHRQQLILKCIWDNGGRATVPEMIDIMEQNYDKGNRMTVQGMNTSLQELLKKDLVQRVAKRRQSFIYEATLTEEQFRNREFCRFRTLTFNGASSAMMTTFVNNVGDDEIDELVDIVMARKEKKNQ